MTVKELMFALSTCNPDTPVIVETEEWASGSSATGAYEVDVDRQIDTVSDLETRVVITLCKDPPTQEG